MILAFLPAALFSWVLEECYLPCSISVLLEEPVLASGCDTPFALLPILC